MKKLVSLSIVLLLTFQLFSQDTVKSAEPEKYKFDTLKILPATPVKDQYRSGTCWSFAAVSYLESELIRLGSGETDLSEMFFVNHAYREKAKKYIRYHGSSNFGPGGQAHDVMNIIKSYGYVSETGYPGIVPGETSHNHGELDKVLKGFLDAVLASKSGKLSQAWYPAYLGILDAYLGKLPENSKQTTQKINPDDYIELTSYSHNPYYTWINLEIPDNWSNDKYFNLPLDELMSLMFDALNKGYTIAWDGDVSDKGFSHSNGIAILPDKDIKSLAGSERERWEKLSEKDKNAELYKFETPGNEKKVTPEMRQEAFDSHLSTDDHLMHVIGIAVDQKGTRYLITKNSWAANSNKYGGYLKISEPYARMHTIAFMVHKDALPGAILKKAGE